MISDRATATKVEKMMRGVAAEIDESISVVLDGGSTSEFKSYRLTAGKLMGDIFLEILAPIYARHPDLTPPELRPGEKA
jgi:hypothetical protein